MDEFKIGDLVKYREYYTVYEARVLENGHKVKLEIVGELGYCSKKRPYYTLDPGRQITFRSDDCERSNRLVAILSSLEFEQLDLNTSEL